MTKRISFACIMMMVTLAGCRQKVIHKDLVLDVTKPYRIPLFGKDGDKFGVKIKGRFVGKIKIAMTGYKNELTEGDFAVYQDSIDFDMGFMNIYTDNTGFTWYIRPVDAKAGTIIFSLTEIR